MSAIVEIEDLAVGFPGAGGRLQRVVDGVSLRVEEGKTAAVVGESGSGKSLTMLALLGLLPPPARVIGGRLNLGGVDVRFAPEPVLVGLRGRLAGLVQQDPGAAFDPVRRLWPQVSEAATRHGLVRTRGERRALATRLLAEAGLDDPAGLAGAFAHQLSGGQRQRAAIAAALSARPRLLVADEPTSALDSVSQVGVLRLLARLRDERGLALLLVTHDLRLAANVADQVTILLAGETVEDGPCQQVLDGPAHPYTRCLLAGKVAPPPDDRAGRTGTPGGCRFAPRCPEVMTRCREARPALTASEDGRQVRCFLWHEATERGDG